MRIRELTVIFFAALLMTACGGVRLDPLKLKVTDVDRIAAEFPPSPEELAAPRKIVLPLALRGEGITSLRFEKILKFVCARLEKHGDLEIVPEEFVEKAFPNKNDREFSPGDLPVAEAIELGKSFKASFVVRIRANISDSRARGDSDRFSAAIKLVFFGTGSGKMLFSREMSFDSRKPEKTDAELKKLIQHNFPVKGFILETRGGRQAARISAGRASGVSLGRKFQTRERKAGKRPGAFRYETANSATLEVIKVMENDSWVEIKKKDRDKIKKGQVVFSIPEE